MRARRFRLIRRVVLVLGVIVLTLPGLRVRQAERGPAVAATVMLHGLTDSPFSQRHIGARCQALGYVVIAIRMPRFAKPEAAWDRTSPCTWWAFPTVARWRCSTRWTPSKTPPCRACRTSCCCRR